MQIVFSGHGAWFANYGFTQLPARCSMKFFTLNAKTLSDSFGGQLDQGLMGSYKPDQVVNQYSNAPNMLLYPPTGLSIQTPDPASWDVWTIGGNNLPSSGRNMQVQIAAHERPYYLSEMISWLDDTIRAFGPVELVWAACRELKMAQSNNLGTSTNVRPPLSTAEKKGLGINSLQR